MFFFPPFRYLEGLAHFPLSRKIMNSELRRRTDEVVGRLTQLRDSL
jgi:hypothetical protein